MFVIHFYCGFLFFDAIKFYEHKKFHLSKIKDPVIKWNGLSVLAICRILYKDGTQQILIINLDFYYVDTKDDINFIIKFMILILRFIVV